MPETRQFQRPRGFQTEERRRSQIPVPPGSRTTWVSNQVTECSTEPQTRLCMEGAPKLPRRTSCGDTSLGCNQQQCKQLWGSGAGLPLFGDLSAWGRCAGHPIRRPWGHSNALVHGGQLNRVEAAIPGQYLLALACVPVMGCVRPRMFRGHIRAAPGRGWLCCGLPLKLRVECRTLASIQFWLMQLVTW